MLLSANPQDNLIKPSLKQCHRLTTDQTHYHKLLQSSLAAFQKPYEHRTSTQIALINELIHKMHFFKALQSYASSESLKAFLKYGKVIKVGQRKMVYEVGSGVDCFVVGLLGRFGVVGEPQEQKQGDIQVMKDEEMYVEYLQQLKNFSPKYLQFLKKKQHRQPRPFKPTLIDLSQHSLTSQFRANLQHQLLFLPSSLFLTPNQHKKYPHTFISLSSDCYLFELQFKRLCQIMREQYNKTILRRVQIFARFGSFGLFKKEKLKQMVQEMQIKKYKKGDIVFQQKQDDKRMFVLVKGEIQMERMAVVGSENPNNLYKNRLSLKRSSHSTRIKDTIQAIPFADFSKLYNSSSQLKKVKLTRLSPISIFGQQQLLASTPRQTTAKVTSLLAELYVFTLQELSKYFTPDSPYKGQDFLKILSEEISEKKMLYRQEKLGGEVEWLNRSWKGGFYQHDGEPKNKNNSTRRMQITNCMNKTIPVRLPPENTITKDNEDDQQTKMFLTATFNYHNFQQFYSTPKPKPLQQPLSTHQPSSKSPHKPTPLSSQQKQILKLLHGNQRTVIKTAHSSRIKSSRGSFAIDLDKPLFTPEYFRQQLERSRKIDKEMKRAKLNSLYQSSQGLGMGKSRTLSSSGAKVKGKSEASSGFRRNLSYQI